MYLCKYIAEYHYHSLKIIFNPPPHHTPQRRVTTDSLAPPRPHQHQRVSVNKHILGGRPTARPVNEADGAVAPAAGDDGRAGAAAPSSASDLLPTLTNQPSRPTSSWGGGAR